ncbi:MAG: M24 family metallopeptidase [Sphingobacteriales bacterium]|nr:MAG: M24 family metallopeptidase [Sphingobacteriales bacterium]TAF83999.1 MAG: M24 family metallopeptidase [Sphingobacteriales bacterium]
MKYNKINKNIFIQNRLNFTKLLTNNSLCILKSSNQYLKSGDQAFDFKQNADLFYLSGIIQEDSILLLFPSCINQFYSEVLFIKHSNAHIEQWEGKKLTIKAAQEISGIQNVQCVADFDNILASLVYYADNIYLNTNENDRNSDLVVDGNKLFVNEIKLKYPLHHFIRAAPLFRQLRAVKSNLEVDLIKLACGITRDAFNRVIKFVKPNVYEYEIEAEVIHEFIKQRATGHAYTPIIASGKNACILHYNDNNQICADGDVVLFDFGAEYANYNADMSRAIPVNGKFTTRQKAVYNAVLHVFNEAKKMLLPGTIWSHYQDEVGKIMTDQLIKLNLLTKHDVQKQDPKMPAYKKYFMHGTSHHLGLDVHDLASRYQAFAVGNVLTCEPGIYIKEENLGIRLENNIYISPDGPVDLMANIPIEADEIEYLMQTS